MRNFYKKLISNDDTASSRRFIAVWTLPWYWASIACGLYVGTFFKDFRFFLTSVIAALLPIGLAFFALTWQHIIEILNTKLFNKKNKNTFENTDEFIDP